MYYTKFDTSICEIILVGNEEGLRHLHLNTGEGKRVFEISRDWTRNDEFFTDTIEQIKDYFAGERTSFDIKLAANGTEYQRKVWAELRRIPFGQTRSYGEIAAGLGNKNAARAVGMANSKNPIPIITPCHRVIGSGGKLTGFAHGLTIKQQLLDIEAKIHL